jgi:hypothetical protein
MMMMVMVVVVVGVLLLLADKVMAWRWQMINMYSVRRNQRGGRLQLLRSSFAGLGGWFGTGEREKAGGSGSFGRYQTKMKSPFFYILLEG